MNKNREPRVGLDSQCLSYLIDAVAGIEEPTDPLAEQRKALIRIWFYTPGAYYVSETIVKEVSAIRTAHRRELHESFVQVLILDPPVQNRMVVDARAAQLAVAHPKQNDCRILAEAEDLQFDTFLTYDRDLRQRLDSTSNTVRIITPSSYWANLNIPWGARPISIPHPTNPLSMQSWWRWS